MKQIFIILLMVVLTRGFSQTDSVWTLAKCIEYAQQKNIDVRKADLSNSKSQVSVKLAKAAYLPNLSASISHNFGLSKEVDQNNNYGSYKSSNSTSYGVNSSVTVFDGFKTKNTIKQAELNYNSGLYDLEYTKENLSLNILDAYLQVLYANEEVKNSRKQINLTQEQLKLAEQRLQIGTKSKADYLQVKSQLASEKSSLATAEKTLAINRVTLMQLMEIPVSKAFKIEQPNFSDSIDNNIIPNADEVFKTAIGIKPQVKSAEIQLQSSTLGVDIAKAGYIPKISVNGAISTGYTSGGNTYMDQVSNRITPSVGLSLSIPIFQNRSVRSAVDNAKIETTSAELSLIATKNTLRKSIEQACVDVESAQYQYEASIEQYNSAFESYKLSEEKYNQGALNSVDFLVQKTNLISAEKELLKSKYNLIFSYKILDFYSGKQLNL